MILSPIEPSGKKKLTVPLEAEGSVLLPSA